MLDMMGPEVGSPDRTVSCASPSVPVQTEVGPPPVPGSLPVRRALIEVDEL